jgi:hypothetical protein
MYGQLHIINENEKSTKKGTQSQHIFQKVFSTQIIATEHERSIPDPNSLNQDSNPDPGFMLESESGSKHHFFCPKIVVDALFGDQNIYSPS